tara:strand:- start:98 stop:568 length:471 start_codon:yes stop_codon:yes gene_type:complete
MTRSPQACSLVQGSVIRGNASIRCYSSGRGREGAEEERMMMKKEEEEKEEEEEQSGPEKDMHIRRRGRTRVGDHYLCNVLPSDVHNISWLEVEMRDLFTCKLPRDEAYRRVVPPSTLVMIDRIGGEEGLSRRDGEVEDELRCVVYLSISLFSIQRD